MFTMSLIWIAIFFSRPAVMLRQDFRGKRSVSPEWVHGESFLDVKTRLEDQPDDLFRTVEKPRSHKLCRAIRDFQYTSPGTPPEWTILALARMNHYRYKHGAHMLVLHREICLLAQFLTDGMASTGGILATPEWKTCGANYYVHHGDGMTTLNPNTAADAWIKESVNYNYKNVSVNELRLMVNGRPTAGNENFTQMVWEGKYLLYMVLPLIHFSNETAKVKKTNVPPVRTKTFILLGLSECSGFLFVTNAYHYLPYAYN